MHAAFHDAVMLFWGSLVFLGVLYLAYGFPWGLALAFQRDKR